MIPPPDDAALHDAALAHLARYATTEANLRRVLGRRIDRWARAGHPLRCGIASCVALSEAFSLQAVSSAVIQLSIEAS